MASDDSKPLDSTTVRLVHSLGKAFERVEQRVRERAYQISQGRGSSQADPVADWLDAQWEVLAPVELVLKDQKKNIVVEGSLKGFKPGEIEIEVGVHTLRVFGSHIEPGSTKEPAETRLSSEVTYFYQVIPLPCEVETAAGQAKLLKNGKLRIALPKKQ